MPAHGRADRGIGVLLMTSAHSPGALVGRISALRAMVAERIHRLITPGDAAL